MTCLYVIGNGLVGFHVKIRLLICRFRVHGWLKAGYPCRNPQASLGSGLVEPASFPSEPDGSGLVTLAGSGGRVAISSGDTLGSFNLPSPRCGV